MLIRLTRNRTATGRRRRQSYNLYQPPASSGRGDSLYQIVNAAPGRDDDLVLERIRAVEKEDTSAEEFVDGKSKFYTHGAQIRVSFDGQLWGKSGGCSCRLMTMH